MHTWRMIGIVVVLAVAVALPWQQALSQDEERAERLQDQKIDRILKNQQDILAAVELVQQEFPEIKEQLRIIKVRATRN